MRDLRSFHLLGARRARHGAVRSNREETMTRDDKIYVTLFALYVCALFAIAVVGLLRIEGVL